DPDELRSKEEKDTWFARDPIKRFEAYLLEQQILEEAALKEIRDRIQTTIDEALSFAEESPEPNPDDLYKYIFAED
ncbi:MAG: thiamine pyrophosphate-dependent enzyme, partial [Nodosilinea sp.]